MKGTSGVTFDTPGTRPSAAQVNSTLQSVKVPTPTNTVPEKLRAKPEYQKLEQRSQQNQTKMDSLNQKLQQVQQQRMNSTGEEKGKLEVQEVRLQQEISNVRNDNNFVEVQKRDMQVKFEEEAAAQSASPAAK
jgi:uncharacterized protein (DUF342 family)